MHAATVAELRSRQADALAGSRKREISDTATRRFAESGYHQTAIAQIARALAIGHGTVYRHFENKREPSDRCSTALPEAARQKKLDGAL